VAATARTMEAAWDAAAVRAESMAANSAESSDARSGGRVGCLLPSSARKSPCLCLRAREVVAGLWRRGEEEVEEVGGL
jgi:hypothetical protein